MRNLPSGRYWPAGCVNTYKAPPMPRVAPGGSDRYALAAFAGEVDTVLAAAPGTRNDCLNRAAHALGSLVAAGRLDGHQVVAALAIAAEHIGLPEPEATRTITSGMTAGANIPRPASSTSTMTWRTA